MDMRCTLVGPPALLPEGLAESTTDIDAIRDADVVYVLRMQHERMQAGGNFLPSLREGTARSGIPPPRVGAGRKGSHPGAPNRRLGNRPRDGPRRGAPAEEAAPPRPAGST